MIEYTKHGGVYTQAYWPIGEEGVYWDNETWKWLDSSGDRVKCCRGSIKANEILITAIERYLGTL